MHLNLSVIISSAVFFVLCRYVARFMWNQKPLALNRWTAFCQGGRLEACSALKNRHLQNQSCQSGQIHPYQLSIFLTPWKVGLEIHQHADMWKELLGHKCCHCQDNEEWLVIKGPTCILSCCRRSHLRENICLASQMILTCRYCVMYILVSNIEHVWFMIHLVETIEALRFFGAIFTNSIQVDQAECGIKLIIFSTSQWKFIRSGWPKANTALGIAPWTIKGIWSNSMTNRQ